MLHVSILHEQPIPGPPGPPGPPGSNVRDMCTLCNHMQLVHNALAAFATF